MGNRRNRSSSNESRLGREAAIAQKITSRLATIDEAVKSIEMEHENFSGEFKRRLRFRFRVERLENLFAENYSEKLTELLSMGEEVAQNQKRVIDLERKLEELSDFPMTEEEIFELEFWTHVVNTINIIIASQINLIELKKRIILEAKEMLEFLKHKAELDRSLAFATTAELKGTRRNLILERNHLQSILRRRIKSL